MNASVIKNPLNENWIPETDTLKSKTILITGAGDGIGAIAAQTFAKYGATVILLGRTTEKLESVYDKIVSNGDPEPFIYPMDLMSSDPEDYEKLANNLRDEVGSLDGLLLNAAVLGQRTPIASTKTKAWMDCIQINLHSNFLMVHALQGMLEESSAGRILFTSSSVGRVGRAYWSAYSVSKFGVEGLMQVLADELENVSNIRVNSINPGATRTGMRAAAFPGETPNAVKAPMELMNLYTYLMSEESNDIHGKAIDF